jgi:hypothetical protein
MATRLFVLLAREAPVAVVFRRGPSGQVLLVRWNLQKDTFEAGQWLKGRIYEERCDLSPRGDRLVYFAANWKEPFRTWTAVSRPPYLTALAIWPKGDTWGGGGFFEDQDTLLLAHDASQCFTDGPPPTAIKVRPLTSGGYALEGPIFFHRLTRGGWRLVQELSGKPRKQPEIWSKECPKYASRPELRMYSEGVREKNGPWYVRRFELVGPEGDAVALGRADWADWSSDGDLLLARAGKIHRLPRNATGADDPWSAARELVDLSSLSFEGRAAPPEAKAWNGPPPAGYPLPRSECAQ